MAARQPLPPLEPDLTDPRRSFLVDDGRDASVSFAPPVASRPGRLAGADGSGSRLLAEHAPLVAVGPGRLDSVTPARPARNARSVSGFPIQLAKIQPPLVRDDVLSRTRLNAWLDANARRRLVLVVAEAGFGKTTLLGDWSRRTARRTLWYRLDSDDRDWLTFLNHLVATGRRLDPAFGEESEELLSSLGQGGPTRAAIVSSLVRELSELSEGGASIVFDDFQVVDETEDIVHIVRTLIERTPQSLSFVIASRRDPRIPTARLRGQGEVVDLDAGALSFDSLEIDRLFRTMYDLPLDERTVAAVKEKTEGWPASLQLIRTAVADLDPEAIHAFVDRLSGARGEMHDFLAQEVLGSVTPELRAFLMRSAVLDYVDAPTAFVVGGGETVSAVQDRIREAEQIGLLSRREVEDRQTWRFHPLLRDFLRSRLEAEFGSGSMTELHLKAARYFDGRDWRQAAQHFHSASAIGDVRRVIESSLDAVLGRGEYLAAKELLEDSADASPYSLILESRVHLQHGEPDGAVASARAALAAATDPGSHAYGAALVNLFSISANTAHWDDVLAVTARLRLAALSEPHQELAAAMIQLVEVSDRGSLPSFETTLRRLVRHQSRRGDLHYVGITNLNLATLAVWRGDSEAAIEYASLAEQALQKSSSGFEIVSALLARARALAQLGRWTGAVAAMEVALSTTHPVAFAEALIEAAETVAWYGDQDAASVYLEQLKHLPHDTAWTQYRLASLAGLGIRLRDQDALREAWQLYASDRRLLPLSISSRFRSELAICRLALFLGDSSALELSRELMQTAAAQQSRMQQAIAGVVRGLTDPKPLLSPSISIVPSKHAHILSVLADEITACTHVLDESAIEVVGREVESRPERWLTAIRREVENGTAAAVSNARLLELYGSAEDIPLLRKFSRSRRHRSNSRIGDQLVKRHAKKVVVQDLGRVRIVVGGEILEGSRIRRKVLALLCFLLAQPDATANRDQVLDALWPDFDPSSANNSLNQTLYFLRRVLEPSYSEETSAGYVHFEGEVVWLDLDLMDSESRRLWRLLQTDQAITTWDQVAELVAAYKGRFAADFAYEEWSASYRDGLHAGVLEVAERWARGALSRGAIEAIPILQRLLAVDPEASELEAILLRLYRDTGAPSAAAEQYGHYASVLRDGLGVEPPPLDEV